MSASDKKTRKSLTKKPLATAIGAAFLATAVAPIASAEANNPFVATSLDAGYDLANYGRNKTEGSCGEGTCGDSPKPTKGDSPKPDSKNGKGSCGEGTCGGSPKPDKTSQGKCGKGTCGGDNGSAKDVPGSERDDKRGLTNTIREGRKKPGQGVCGDGSGKGARGQPQ